MQAAETSALLLGSVESSGQTHVPRSAGGGKEAILSLTDSRWWFTSNWQLVGCMRRPATSHRLHLMHLWALPDWQCRDKVWMQQCTKRPLAQSQSLVGHPLPIYRSPESPSLPHNSRNPCSVVMRNGRRALGSMGKSD
jgi:hypothetical protein